GDPVAAGFVENLARPGGNATGFMTFEYGMAGEGVGLLEQTPPPVTRGAGGSGPPPPPRPPPPRAGPSPRPLPPARGQRPPAAAPSAGTEVRPIDVRDAAEIERGIAASGRASNGGLIVTASAASQVHRNLIITLAARHKLPAVYYERLFASAGGLISYGPDFVDQFRRAAAYVD